MPGDFGVPVCSCAQLLYSCTRDRGCAVHPVSPTPFGFEGGGFWHDPGEKNSRRGNAEVCPGFWKIESGRHTLRCHHPRRRVIQYPRDASVRVDKPRRTGSPACAGDDERKLVRDWEAVIAGLDPAIHPSSQIFSKAMDHRVKPGDDDPAGMATARASCISRCLTAASTEAIGAISSNTGTPAARALSR
jgi:hypothetical protein